MKKFALSILAVVILGIVGIALIAARNADPDSPAEVAQRMIGALEQHTAADLQRTFCDPDLAELVLASSQAGIQFTGLRYREAPHPTTGITVAITGRVTSSAGAGKAITWRLWLQQSGGEWCIVNLDMTSQESTNF